jgi:hypothetical protein
MGATPLISAPQVAAFINGAPYGLVYSFDWNSSTPRKRIHSIDILQSIELAPLGTDVSFTMGLYRLRGGGGIEGANITVPLPDLAQENYFSVTLVDIVTKFIIFAAQECSVESQNWAVATKQFLTGTISCSAKSFNNEVVALNGR